MKTKKTIIAVLTAVLLVSAVLVIGCMSPVDGASFSQDGVSGGGGINYKIPAGKGVVRFNISDENARTVMPDSIPAITAMTYTVQFVERGGDGTNDFNIPANIPSDAPVASTVVNSTPISLVPGTYDITITAFDSAGTTPIAGWVSPASGPTSVSITAGGTTNVSAALNAKVDGTGSGYFNYTINLPNPLFDFDPPNNEFYATRSVVLTKYGTSTTQGTFPTLGAGANTLTGTTGNAVVPSGYYLVTVTVAHLDYLTKEYVRVLHVYPTLTSTMPTITVGALVKNKFTVTFEPEDNGVSDNTTASGNNYADQKIGYGNKITAFNAPVADDGTSSFDAWYSDSSFTTKWTFAVNRVLADTDLFMKWIPAGTKGNVNFNITFTFSDKMTASITGGGPVNLTNLWAATLPTTYTLTLGTAPNSGTWTGVTWHMGGKSTAGDLLAYLSGNDLVINDSVNMNELLIPGTIEVTVTATLSGSSVPSENGPYSATVNVTVTN